MRLIDADKLTDKLIGLNDYRKVCDIIKDMPTQFDDLISANDFKKRLDNMEYVFLQDSYSDIIDAIDCEITYFKEKINHGKK